MKLNASFPQIKNPRSAEDLTIRVLVLFLCHKRVVKKKYIPVYCRSVEDAIF